MDAKLDLVKSWLDKARRDLASAQWLAVSPDPYLDTAIYHCQQAAEKALKGWLTFHDLRFEKTHDLRMLAILAAGLDADFLNQLDSAELLTPFAAAYRYPGERLQPEPENSRKRCKLQKSFLNLSATNFHLKCKFLLKLKIQLILITNNLRWISGSNREPSLIG